VVLGTALETVYIPGLLNISDKNIMTPMSITNNMTISSFPINDIYYITPQPTNIVITLPTPSSSSKGAKTTFKIVSSGVGSVTITSTAINPSIYPGTSNTAVTSYEFYTGSSSTTWSYATFAVLANNSSVYGWYQIE